LVVSRNKNNTKHAHKLDWDVKRKSISNCRRNLALLTGSPDSIPLNFTLFNAQNSRVQSPRFAPKINLHSKANNGLQGNTASIGLNPRSIACDSDKDIPRWEREPPNLHN